MAGHIPVLRQICMNHTLVEAMSLPLVVGMRKDTVCVGEGIVLVAGNKMEEPKTHNTLIHCNKHGVDVPY